MTSQEEDTTVQTGEATVIPAPLVNPPERASSTLSEFSANCALSLALLNQMPFFPGEVTLLT